HFAVVYSLVGLRCGAPPAWLPRIGEVGLRAGLLLASLAALTAIAWLAWSARRRLLAAAAGAADAQAWPRPRFLARVQLGIAGLAAVAVGFTLLPMLVLEPC